MRNALIVGIDYYRHGPPLFGCVNDAHSMKSVLERNGDGTVNFDVRLLSATGPSRSLEKRELKDAIARLFATDAEISLFYFAGHGHIETTGGYLLDSEARHGDEGIPLSDVITFANQSKAKNKIVILDSCHSGIAAEKPGMMPVAELTEGLTILTASTADQYAREENGKGIFTSLFVDAMSGAAANLVGEITPGSVYAHIDKTLGWWEQRPVYKTNVKYFASLRRIQPPIELADLLRLPKLFPEPGFELRLDPSFEPELAGRPDGAPPPKEENVTTFAVLQKYNRLNLLVPVGAPHMWHAAMNNKSCRLTVLGEHYRCLVEKNRI